MQDNFLYDKITEALHQICNNSQFKRIDEMLIRINPGSSLNTDCLHQHLKIRQPGVIGEWTVIQVQKENIEPLTAVIQSIKGEKEV